jgi:transposase
MSKRAIARQFGISRDSVDKMIVYSVPPGYRRRAPVRRPKLDGFTEVIDRWLHEDAERPRKQRHTAKRVLDRLREGEPCRAIGPSDNGERFTGGHTIVKAYVREHQRRGREMFVPPHHAPGQAQADFGESLVVIGGVEQKAHCFVLDLPHRDACYVRAYPTATAEAWADGHVHAFALFGRVPLSVLYDSEEDQKSIQWIDFPTNRCLVARILPDGTRKRAALFSGLLSHYVIEDRYGRPGKGGSAGWRAAGTIMICTIFAAMAGISGAATVAMGILALPAMLSRGYSKRLALGSIAAGGSLGILIPPSVTMIVYGLIANTSIGKLYAGGVLPALMLAAMFIAYYVLVRGHFQPHLAPPAEDDGRFALREKLISLRGLIFPFLLVGMVLGRSCRDSPASPKRPRSGRSAASSRPLRSAACTGGCSARRRR